VNPYRRFIQEIVRALADADEARPRGDLEPAPRPDIPADAPAALIFSPHPDDECIIGGLPLRLLRELRMRVVNVAVTQGSRRERQRERFAELTGACRYLGFGLIQTREGGLERITAAAREREPRHWDGAVERVRAIIDETRPRAVFLPHDDDGNSTHVGTHFLVTDALARAAGGGPLHVFETEFWRPMADPNLLVESSEEDVADLVAALSFHVGEVERNPYHLRLPAWMIDNVRRGGEIVGSQGGAPPDFTFATIYRHSTWENGALSKVSRAGASVSATDDLSNLLN